MGFAQDSLASSPSAEGEIPISAFLVASFLFAPIASKENAAKEFVQSDKLYAFGLQPQGRESKDSLPLSLLIDNGHANGGNARLRVHDLVDLRDLRGLERVGIHHDAHGASVQHGNALLKALGGDQ